MSTHNIPLLYRRLKRFPYIIAICFLSMHHNYPSMASMVPKIFELLNFDGRYKNYLIWSYGYELILEPGPCDL